MSRFGSRARAQARVSPTTLRFEQSYFGSGIGVALEILVWQVAAVQTDGHV